MKLNLLQVETAISNGRISCPENEPSDPCPHSTASHTLDSPIWQMKRNIVDMGVPTFIPSPPSILYHPVAIAAEAVAVLAALSGVSTKSKLGNKIYKCLHGGMAVATAECRQSNAFILFRGRKSRAWPLLEHILGLSSSSCGYPSNSRCLSYPH